VGAPVQLSRPSVCQRVLRPLLNHDARCRHWDPRPREVERDPKDEYSRYGKNRYGCCSMLQCIAVCCSVLQYVAVCCSMLQCVAVCCSVLKKRLYGTTRYELARVPCAFLSLSLSHTRTSLRDNSSRTCSCPVRLSFSLSLSLTHTHTYIPMGQLVTNLLVSHAPFSLSLSLTHTHTRTSLWDNSSRTCSCPMSRLCRPAGVSLASPVPSGVHVLAWTAAEWIL